MAPGLEAKPLGSSSLRFQFKGQTQEKACSEPDVPYTWGRRPCQPVSHPVIPAALLDLVLASVPTASLTCSQCVLLPQVIREVSKAVPGHEGQTCLDPQSSCARWTWTSTSVFTGPSGTACGSSAQALSQGTRRLLVKPDIDQAHT